jgi:hypothetical protein
LVAVVPAGGHAEALVENILRHFFLAVISGGVGQRERHAGPEGRRLVLGLGAAVFKVQRSRIFKCPYINLVGVVNGWLLSLLSETLVFKLELVELRPKGLEVLPQFGAVLVRGLGTVSFSQKL